MKYLTKDSCNIGLSCKSRRSQHRAEQYVYTCCGAACESITQSYKAAGGLIENVVEGVVLLLSVIVASTTVYYHFLVYPTELLIDFVEHPEVFLLGSLQM